MLYLPHPSRPLVPKYERLGPVQPSSDEDWIQYSANLRVDERIIHGDLEDHRCTLEREEQKFFAWLRRSGQHV